jgi:heme/copper-type cytochrome/quinol oxidase subunit 1
MGDNTTPEEYEPRKPARLPDVVLPIAGLVVLLVGCVVAWLNRNTYIGWFAYAPLSNQPFSGTGMAFLSPGTQAGLAIAVVGLLLLAFWAGFKAGRKAGRERPDQL